MVFSELRASDSKYLVIDIRENGGGDDVLWIEGIMPYIAKKKWQRMAHFLGGVRDIDDAFPGRVGEVAIFDYLGEFEVSEHPKFEGHVYVLIGRRTYSSACTETVSQESGAAEKTRLSKTTTLEKILWDMGYLPNNL